jgi:phosphoserine phosphatase SerB
MKYKLVVFDLDGTIVDNIESVWKTLHEFFGINKHPKRIEIREKFFSGEIPYHEWAERDLDLMAEHGANKKTIMKALEKTKLMDGTMETLETLKNKGCKLAVISGSLNVLLERLIPDYKRIFDHVFINEICFDNKGKISEIKATPFDMFRKRSGLLNICDLEGIGTKDCAFIGDHDNDIDIAKAAGFSIAFNSKSAKLNEIADVVIEKKDLREILKYLN